MSKKFRTTTIILTLICVISFTVFGVFAAKKVSELPFGSNIEIEGLDKTDETVGMINVLLLGVDKDGTRSDTMMLLSYDGYSNRVNVLSFPRDTMVKSGGYYQKLNGAMGVGLQNVKKGKDKEPEEEIIRQVKDLTGLPINYFVTIDFDGFKEVVDALGGVDFNVPYNMNYDDPVQDLHIHLQAGQQHLDGQKAHDFVRFRQNNDHTAPGEYVHGDIGRIYWQQEFVKEFIKQKLKPQFLAKVTDVFDVIEKNVRTNYTMQDLLKHIEVLEDIKLEEIESYQLPGEARYIDDLWWYVYDDDKTVELVSEVFMPRLPEEINEDNATED